MRTHCLTTIIAASTLAFATPVFAEHAGPVRSGAVRSGPVHSGAVHSGNNTFYAYGDVIRTTPIVSHTTESIPRRECSAVPHRRVVRRDHRGDSVVPALLGGLIGGAVGHQFGKGNGKKALTIAGAFAGASIASSASSGKYRDRRHDEYTERCRVVRETREITTVEGYRVTYVYLGRQFVRTMDNDPGDRVRIRVQIQPVTDAIVSFDDYDGDGSHYY